MRCAVLTACAVLPLQLWNRKVDTKCLMAWNDNLVVLSFRGTASMRNVLADVKVLQLQAPTLQSPMQHAMLGSRHCGHRSCHS